MKKMLFIIFCVCTLLLTACGKKTTKKYTGDNIDTPFIELSPNSQKIIEKAFFVEDIWRYSKINEYIYSIQERNEKTINWYENQTKKNINDYHYWFTCYYDSNDLIVFQVERADRDIQGHRWMYYHSSYEMGELIIDVSGCSLENYTYILVYKNEDLFELDCAYKKGLINDIDAKEIYNNYINIQEIKPKYS